MRAAAHVPAAACLAAAAILAAPGLGQASAGRAGIGPWAQAADTVCVVDDDRATELSGLVSTGTGYVAINDGQYDPSDIRIFYLDQRCRVTKTLAYPTAARDPEDLAIAPDGTLWVGDIGDNLTSETHRATIALWRIPKGGGKPVIYRLSYPDGPHDAEALLFTDDGRPLIITKELGPALLYRPTAALKPGGTVPLEQVGSFTPTVTGAESPLGAISEAMVTGAAISPDRERVALRTYTAAYEWDVTDGDLVRAITTGTPRRTDLPDEPQGEAIAYTMDGSGFLTLSDEAGPTTLRRHARSDQPAASPTPSGSPPATPDATASNGAPGPIDGIGVAVLIVGGSGLLLAVLGLIGVRRGRSRHDADRPTHTGRHR